MFVRNNRAVQLNGITDESISKSHFIEYVRFE